MTKYLKRWRRYSQNCDLNLSYLPLQKVQECVILVDQKLERSKDMLFCAENKDKVLESDKYLLQTKVRFSRKEVLRRLNDVWTSQIRNYFNKW